jgi:hypothetical protein
MNPHHCCGIQWFVLYTLAIHSEHEFVSMMRARDKIISFVIIFVSRPNPRFFRYRWPNFDYTYLVTANLDITEQNVPNLQHWRYRRVASVFTDQNCTLRKIRVGASSITFVYCISSIGKGI